MITDEEWDTFLDSLLGPKGVANCCQFQDEACALPPTTRGLWIDQGDGEALWQDLCTLHGEREIASGRWQEKALPLLPRASVLSDPA